MSEGFKFLTTDPMNDYELVEVLGEGSYGAVYRAKSLHDGAEVAIKIIQAEDDLSELKEEIEILHQANCDYVVGFTNCYLFDGELWIVMEFCEGGSINDIMEATQTTLDEEEIKAVCAYTVLGLMYLHKNNQIHRDIKAGNILVSEDGVAKLADFGVSAKLSSTAPKRKTVIGTPFWMAPEVLQESLYDAKADVWSLGITCIEIAEGNPPHYNIHPMRAIFMIPNRPPPTLKDPTMWSRDFNDFLRQCLQKDPANRPSAEDLSQHPFIVHHCKSILKKASKCSSLLRLLLDRSLPSINRLRKEASTGSGGSGNEQGEDQGGSGSSSSSGGSGPDSAALPPTPVSVAAAANSGGGGGGGGGDAAGIADEGTLPRGQGQGKSTGGGGGLKFRRPSARHLLGSNTNSRGGSGSGSGLDLKGQDQDEQRGGGGGGGGGGGDGGGYGYDADGSVFTNRSGTMVIKDNNGNNNSSHQAKATPTATQPSHTGQGQKQSGGGGGGGGGGGLSYIARNYFGASDDGVGVGVGVGGAKGGAGGTDATTVGTTTTSTGGAGAGGGAGVRRGSSSLEQLDSRTLKALSQASREQELVPPSSLYYDTPLPALEVEANTNTLNRNNNTTNKAAMCPAGAAGTRSISGGVTSGGAEVKVSVRDPTIGLIENKNDLIPNGDDLVRQHQHRINEQNSEEISYPQSVLEARLAALDMQYQNDCDELKRSYEKERHRIEHMIEYQKIKQIRQAQAQAQA